MAVDRATAPAAVTVAVVSHNGGQVAPACVESVFAQTARPAAVLFVDNASTDGTPERIAERFPEARIVRRPVNDGPNPARNLGIVRSEHDLVLLVDDDTVLAPTCLEELLAAARARPDGALWAPRIVYHDRRDTIQLEGVFMHYLSEAILLNPERPLAQGAREIVPIDLAAGICLLVRKQAALAIGLFDEYYFFGRTDGEFTFRLSLAGHRLYAVPAAVCWHKVKRRGLTKVFYQVRNRWYLILTTYSLRSLVLLAPALLVYEVSVAGFLLAKGKIADYGRALGRLLRDLPKIAARRRQVQSLKRVPDRQVLRCGPINMRGDLLDRSPLAAVKRGLDGFFGLYWRLVHRLL